MNEEIVQVIGRMLDRRRSIATSGWSLIGRSFSRDRCRKWKRHESSFLRLTHESRTFDLGFSLSLLAAVVRRGLMKSVIEADAVGPIDRQESRRGCLAANHRPLCKGPTLFSSLPLVRWDSWVDSARDTHHRTSTLLLYRVKQTFITLIRPTSRIYSRCTRIKFIVA